MLWDLIFHRIKLFPVKFYGTMKKNGTIKFSKISTGEKEDTFISKAEGKIITNKRNFKNSSILKSSDNLNFHQQSKKN